MKKQSEEHIPKVDRDQWTAEDIAKEASNKDGDEVVRQMLRGNESDGNADERDVAPTLNADKHPNRNLDEEE